MKSNYRALSELIEKVDERNDDGAITELIGVSIDKCFIKSVANTNGTDLSKYKIIRKNEFAVSLMQVMEYLLLIADLPIRQERLREKVRR